MPQVTSAGVMRLRCWPQLRRVSANRRVYSRPTSIWAGILHVNRQTHPGRGGLGTKETKGRRQLAVPTIDPLRPTVERLTSGKDPMTQTNKPEPD